MPSSTSGIPRSFRGRWTAWVTSPLAAGLILGLFYVFLLASVSEKSATIDEFNHATAGYSYWKFNDYRLDPENGNWSKRWTALALLGGSNPFPARDTADWRESNLSRLSDVWFLRAGPAGGAMLWRGRAMSGLMAVAAGLVVWLWSRRLFGPAGGLWSLGLYVCSPLVLANGALMTSDMPAALFFLLSLWRFDAMLRELSWPRVAASAAATGGLMLAKMSAPIVLPILFAMAAWRVCDGHALRTTAGKSFTVALAKCRALALPALAHGVIIVAMVWGSYSFRYEPSAPGQPTGQLGAPWEWALGLPDPVQMLRRADMTPDQAARFGRIAGENNMVENVWTNAAVNTFDQVLRENVFTPAQAAQLRAQRAAAPDSLPRRIIWFFRRYRLLPESYLWGYANVLQRAGNRISFLNGQASTGGNHWFFPYLVLVKTPLPSLGLLALGLAALITRGGRSGARDAVRPEDATDPRPLPEITFPLWGFIVLYGVIAVASTTNIGIRHLLPVYPVLFVLAGAIIWWLPGPAYAAPARTSPGWTRAGWLAAGLAVLLVADVLRAWPDYIAYFNQLVPPAQAYRHVVDSSLDWGQDLPAAARYIETHPGGGPYFLAYFGTDSPRRYGVKARQVYGNPAIEGNTLPPFWIVPNLSRRSDPAELSKVFARYPDYDPHFALDIGGSVPHLLILRKPESFRLAPGTYLISATLLQNVAYLNVGFLWGPKQEEFYQKLLPDMQPLMADDPDGTARTAALARETSLEEWARALALFEEYRFARLVAGLRHREPDDTIHASILVYHLSAADLARLLNGPAPLDPASAATSPAGGEPK